MTTIAPLVKITKIGDQKFWWQILALVVVSTIAVYAAIDSENSNSGLVPESVPDRSTFNHKPSGSSGLISIAQRSGLKCDVWQHPYRELDSISGVLFINEPKDPIEDFEAQQILDWVRAGNELIYSDNFTYKFMRRLLEKVHVHTADIKPVTDKVIKIAKGAQSMDHLNSVRITAETELNGGTGVLTDNEHTYFTSIKEGKGQIIIGASPSMWENGRLIDRANWSNYQFLLNCVDTNGGSLWFDEKCHGHIESTNIFIFLARGTAGAVCAQLALILTIAIASAGQRFGQTKRISDKRKISNLEFINGLANTYLRARANDSVLEIIEQSFKTRTCKLLKISPTESNEGIVAAFKAQTGADSEAQNLSRLFTACAAARQHNSISNTELQHLISSCDKILAGLAKVLSQRAVD